MSVSKCSPTTLSVHAPKVWALPRSLATTQGIINLFSFPPPTQMFQFSGLALLSEYCIFNTVGCPIRRSGDILLVCSSPQLIAAYHVLHRLSEPRHPPCAPLRCFKSFRSIFFFCENCIYPTTLLTSKTTKNNISSAILFYLASDCNTLLQHFLLQLLSNMSKNLS